MRRGHAERRSANFIEASSLAQRLHVVENPTRHLLFVLAALALGTTAAAQWLNYPAPGIPRLPNGTPNLTAPAPRTLDGKPDLSGLWESERRLQEPLPGRFQPAAPIAIKPEDVVLTPEGEALQRQRTEDRFLGAQCLP